MLKPISKSFSRDDVGKTALERRSPAEVAVHRALAALAPWGGGEYFSTFKLVLQLFFYFAVERKKKSSYTSLSMSSVGRCKDVGVCVVCIYVSV